METILTIGQFILGIMLILSILMQSRGASLSGVFGGTDSVYRTKRGVEKVLFYATIILATLFILISITIVLI